ncbi:TIGR02206 family membrane protein [Alkalihalobacillus trypoxylicola]|uniref:ABC transporter permease n=1 Tax=Alkalihalobacillus trypoxylicola TaxID=519424 RepID=A0A161PJU7_9BACI|nr:TIGR02206 family membrane protein [Alkalihalobacillus trypoxylicola]KYG34128.1 hypothetical protein AZF04_14970 [Alkalihalobacillus trypoxylicola]
MPWWFSYKHNGPDFTMFGAAHLSVLTLLIIACLYFILARETFRNSPKLDRNIRYTLAACLIFLEASYHIWYIVNDAWSVQFALPLHLSSITLITCIFMLITGHKRLIEITFFAGVSSAFLTLITPDVGNFGYPHFRFFHFFLSHAIVIIASIYMIAVKKTMLTFSSVMTVWLYTNLYAALIFLVNFITDGNYLYLMRKPAGPSPFDWFGPWPYYILVLQLVSLILFVFMYGLYQLLFRKGHHHNRKGNNYMHE